MALDIVVDVGDPDIPTPSTTCETTLADVIARTRQYVLTGRREQRNRLAADISAGAESMTFDFPVDSILGGSTLSIDLEQFYVWSGSGSTAVVAPAENGSLAADHAAGTTVRVNTRVSDFDILNAVNDVLRDLSSPGSGLFRIGLAELTVDSSMDGYDLIDAAYPDDILEVYYLEPSNTQRWVKMANKYWRFQREADTAMFPSGFSLTFFRNFAANDGDPIRVLYKTRYSPLAEYTDNVEAVTGLHCDAHDLLWIGAAIRLTDTREIERNQTMSQGEARRASEVPPGAVMQSYSGLQRRWTQRMRAEAARLTRRFPVIYR